MEEDILNYLYQLSCFVGHPVRVFVWRLYGSYVLDFLTFSPYRRNRQKFY